MSIAVLALTAGLVGLWAALAAPAARPGSQQRKSSDQQQKSSATQGSGLPDAIRTGGPSAPGDAKLAVVGSTQDLAGQDFKVLDDNGDTVLTGKLERASGSPSPWAHAEVADLTSIHDNGSYKVEVGSLKSSEPWVVRSSGSRDAIPAILGFFAANSDGNEPSPLHRPSHLHDAVVKSGRLAGQHIDLTGGWMDAGDMLHFTQTTAYAAAALEAAARLDPADASKLDDAADVGVRWLVKAHPEAGVFIAQVGDARDHDLGFRDPADDDSSDKPGIGRRFAYPGIGGDLGGKAATALALAADRTSGARRDKYLAQARDWYAAGQQAARPAPKLPGGFYTGTAWEDDMAAGAAALYRTTGEQSYLNDALRYLSRSNPQDSLDWDTFASFGAADLCGALGAPAVGDANARDAACSFLQKAGQGAADAASGNAFGTPGDISWGQTSENGGAGAQAALAHDAGLNDGLAVAAGARDWLFGRNPWGASFVVGYGHDSPRHPHHWASVFGDGKPDGAVVGGPAPRRVVTNQGIKIKSSSPFNTRKAFYEDRVDDFVTSEPALDYAAGSILLLAALSR